MVKRLRSTPEALEAQSIFLPLDFSSYVIICVFTLDPRVNAQVCTLHERHLLSTGASPLW